MSAVLEAVGLGVDCKFVANVLSFVAEALGENDDKMEGGGFMVES